MLDSATKDLIYQALRRYQQGEFDGGMTSVGMLSPSITGAYDAICEVVYYAVATARKDERKECANLCREYAVANRNLVEDNLVTDVMGRTRAHSRESAAERLAEQIIARTTK
jgi:hypothetical protein